MPASAPHPQPVQFSALAHRLEKQVRGSTDPATVNRYRQKMQNGEDFPPLEVAEVEGALILVDGFHRRDAAEALGRGELPAIITPCGSLEEARWRAFQANLRHGLPLKPKHKRPALRAFIEAGLHRREGGRLLSYRELAAELTDTSYSTVRRWIEADFPELFAEMGGDEGSAPGGLPDHPQPPTVEETLAATARAHIAEAGALLRGLSADARWRAAGDVASLLSELTWDREASRGRGADTSAPF